MDGRTRLRRDAEHDPCRAGRHSARTRGHRAPSRQQRSKRVTPTATAQGHGGARGASRRRAGPIGPSVRRVRGRVPSAFDFTRGEPHPAVLNGNLARMPDDVKAALCRGLHDASRFEETTFELIVGRTRKSSAPRRSCTSPCNQRQATRLPCDLHGGRRVRGRTSSGLERATARAAARTGTTPKDHRGGDSRGLVVHRHTPPAPWALRQTRPVPRGHSPRFR